MTRYLKKIIFASSALLLGSAIVFTTHTIYFSGIFNFKVSPALNWHTPLALAQSATVTYLDTQFGSSLTSASVTSAGVTAGANTLYLATISEKGTAVVNNVSGLGLTWTLIKAQCAARGQIRTEVWRAYGSPATNDTVTATLASAPSSAVIMVSRYTGVDAVSPVGAISSANTLGVNGACSGGTDVAAYPVTAGTFTLTTTAANSVVYVGAGLRQRTHIAGSGYTERIENGTGTGSSDSRIAIEDRTVSTASSVVVNGTLSGTADWSVVAVEVKAGGGSAPDTTPPTVSITSPTNGATVSSTLSVTANASDNVGVVGVQFKLDGANLGAEDTTAPYSISWDTATAGNGAHTLTAVARDAATNSTTSGGIGVTVNNVIADYNITLSPSSQSATQGITANYLVAIIPLNGFNTTVSSWTTTNCPTGGSCTFNFTSCTQTNYANCGNLSIGTTGMTPNIYSGTGVQAAIPSLKSSNTVGVTVTSNGGFPLGVAGAVNRSYSFETYANDPESDPIYYRFNWGDGTPETRAPSSGTVASDTHQFAAHIWSPVFNASVGYIQENYSVYVVACDASTCSLQSDPFVMTIALPSKPGPVSLSSGANPSSDGTVTLSWTPSDPRAFTSVPVSISQYDIWRQFNGGAFFLVGTSVTNSFAESGLADGSYGYYILAKDNTTPTPNLSPQSDFYILNVNRSLCVISPTAKFDWCMLKTDTVQFQDLSVGDGPLTAWNWNFDDGTVCPPDTTCDDQHPYHAYIGGGGASNPWWSGGASWTRRRKITFNNSAHPENLDDFTVLIKLNQPNTGNPADPLNRIDYGQTKANGEDLRFIDANGSTLLAYEIEQWNNTGDSFVWVKVPQIAAASTTDHIWMYYGNATANDAQNVAGTWESSFKGVWHLDELASEGTHQDSTINNNTASNIDVAAQGSTSGKIDGTDSFVAASADNIDIDDSASLDVSVNESFTSEAWINTGGSGDLQFIVNKKIEAGDWPQNQSIYWQLFADTDNTIAFWMSDGVHTTNNDMVRAQTSAASPLANNQWYYVVSRWNHTTDHATIFINGVSAATDASSIVDSIENPHPFVIGQEGDLSRTYNFNGDIDEVRFSKTARSDTWIAAQFQSMNDDAFASYGPEVPPASGGPYNVSLTVTDSCGQNANIQTMVDPASTPTCASTFTLASAVATKCNEVGLSWTPAKAAVSYTLYRRTGAGAWGQILSNMTSLFTYDTTAFPNTSYQYYLEARLPSAGTLTASTLSPVCAGKWSGDPPAQICPLPVPALTTPFCAPSVVPLPPTSGCGSIALVWSPTPDALNYRVWRAIGSDNFSAATLIATPGISQISYTDSAIVPDVTYYYYVTDEKDPATYSSVVFSKSSCFRGSRWQER